MWKQTCSILMALVMFGSLFVILDGAYPLTVGSSTRGSLTPHDPIVIEGNANFTTVNGVRSGSGTDGDPYIISGWDIDPNAYVPCIKVSNTTAHFRIENCMMHHSDLIEKMENDPNFYLLKGISFYHVRNAIIISSSFFDNSNDIKFHYSDENYILDNQINSKNANVHVELVYSSRNKIDNNNIDSLVSYKFATAGQEISGIGITLYAESMRNLVSNNTIRNHRSEGIIAGGYFNLHNRICDNIITNNGVGIRGADMFTNITNNVISYNEWAGIDVDGDHISITNNEISYTEHEGVRLGGGEWVVFNNNIVKDNKENGLFLREEHCFIQYNMIINNGKNGICVEGQRNLIEHNIISTNGKFGIEIVNFTKRGAYPRDDVGHNRIENNDFYDNGNGSVPQACDDDKNPGIDWSEFPFEWGAEPNIWRMNYWDDHSSPDSDGDGIVDVPYNISGNAAVNDSEAVTTPHDIPVQGPIFNLKILTSDRISVKAGSDYSIEYRTSKDLSGSNLTWSMRTNASWLSFSEENVLAGSPTLSDIGVYWVNLSVTDGKAVDRHIFNIYVYETIDPTIGPTGNETEPEKNETEPKNETENQPPQDGRILLPPGEMHEGDELVFSTFVYDPDLKENETLNYTWYIVGIGVVGYGPQIELTLPENNYTIIVNVTDPDGAKVTIEKTIQVLDKGQVIDPYLNRKVDNEWWESPWIIAAIVLLTNLMIIAFFGFAMAYRERQLHEAAFIPGSYDSGLRRRTPPKGCIDTGSLKYSADGILSNIVNEGGISQNPEDLVRIHAGAEKLYKEGKISKSTYRVIRRNIHARNVEE